jgi:hypothetical protein
MPWRLQLRSEHGGDSSWRTHTDIATTHEERFFALRD